MRRTIFCLAGALALAAPLAACGDDDDTTSPPSSAATDGGGGEGNTVTVVANDDLSFGEDAYEATAGEVTFVYENSGSIAHTLLIKQVDDFKLAVGDTDEGSVELEAGTYELYCDIAGHEAAGMVADLTVS